MGYPLPVLDDILTKLEGADTFMVPSPESGIS